MIDTILQRLSEIISVSNDDTASQLTEVYNSLVASIVTPCVLRDDDGFQCGKRAVKLACFKSRSHNLALTIYAGVCEFHLSSLVELPEQFNATLTRFIIGDKIQCKAVPYSVGLVGDNQKENGLLPVTQDR